MSPEQASQSLFEETLSCQFEVACHLHLLTHAASDTSTEMRLRAVALVEDGRTEDADERQEKTLSLQRIEAKLDLLLALCGRLLGSQQPLQHVHDVQLSARGIAIDGASLPSSDSTLNMAVSLQVADWLPDPITLPVMLLASSGLPDGKQRLYLQFEGISPAVKEALDRHVFRLHRRGIAQQRHPRS